MSAPVFFYLYFGGAHVFDRWRLTGTRHNKDEAAQRGRADQVKGGYGHSKLPRPAESETDARSFTFGSDTAMEGRRPAGTGALTAATTLSSERYTLTPGRRAAPYSAQASQSRLQNPTGS